MRMAAVAFFLTGAVSGLSARSITVGTISSGTASYGTYGETAG